MSIEGVVVTLLSSLHNVHLVLLVFFIFLFQIHHAKTDILKSESNLFTREMKDKISQLHSGDVITLEDIKVIIEDKTKRTYMPVSIRIE